MEYHSPGYFAKLTLKRVSQVHLLFFSLIILPSWPHRVAKSTLPKHWNPDCPIVKSKLTCPHSQVTNSTLTQTAPHFFLAHSLPRLLLLLLSMSQICLMITTNLGIWTTKVPHFVNINIMKVKGLLGLWAYGIHSYALPLPYENARSWSRELC